LLLRTILKFDTHYRQVHERGLESDFALTLLLDALQRRNGTSSSAPPLRLILMSATIQTDKFVSYLDAYINKGSGVSTPVLHIPGYTFPVQEYYRGDFETQVRFGGKALMGAALPSAPSSTDGTEEAPVASVSIGGGANMQVNRNYSSSAGVPTSQHRYGGFVKGSGIDFDLIVRLILQLSAGPKASGGSSSAPPMLSRAEGAVLVFMPGVPEINKLIRLVHEALDDIKAGEISVALGHIAAVSDRLRIVTMALHGNLSPAEQARVFEPAGKGALKIVVATNVAEVRKL
jgi:HrpA-like RNA helicase